MSVKRAIDERIVGLEPGYQSLMAEYENILRQRNLVLKAVTTGNANLVNIKRLQVWWDRFV